MIKIKVIMRIECVSGWREKTITIPKNRLSEYVVGNIPDDHDFLSLEFLDVKNRKQIICYVNKIGFVD